MSKMIVKVVYKGGPGSGHHGHEGRPGKRGGSLPGGSGRMAGNLPGGKLPSDSELGNILGVGSNDRGGDGKMRWVQGQWGPERRAKTSDGKVLGEVRKSPEDEGWSASVDFAYAGRDSIVRGGPGMKSSGWYPTRRAAMYALRLWHEQNGTFE